METNKLKTMRLCDIARKMGVSLEEAKKMKADAFKPPKKAKEETKIKESDDVKTDL